MEKAWKKNKKNTNSNKKNKKSERKSKFSFQYERGIGQNCKRFTIIIISDIL